MSLIAPRAAVVAAFLILSAGVVAPSGAPSQQSAERSQVVDFYVLGADGASIPDLKPEELTIRVNGRTRGIQSLRLVKQADLPAADPLAARAIVAPEPYGTNSVAETGRSFVVIVDDESFRPGREKPIRAAMANFLGALSPRDRVSLWTIPHGGMKVDLTTNHDRLSKATELVIGHGPDQETGQEAACRTRTSLEALDHLLSTLEGGEGPTTVIFLTASMLGPRRDAAATMAPGMCELRTDKFERVGKVAAAARAHFFVVLPEDQIPMGSGSVETINGGGFTGNTNPMEGIENLTGVTGGTRMSLARAGDKGLVAIARATASYYSAVVDGAASDIEGTLGLDVKVARQGVTVRSRSQLYIKKAAGVTAQPRTPDEMLKVATTFADLPLRVTGFTSADSEGRLRVIAAAEPVDAGVKFTALSAALYDSTGRLAAQVNANEAELGVQPTLTGLIVAPGTYRLRVAAVDSTGRSGAADTEVVAEVVTAGSLRISSLVLGLNRNGKFQPKLQFGNEPLGIAYLDFFGGKPNTAIGAIIEVAQTMTGPALAVNPLSIEATVDAGRFTARGSIPLGALPPGDYVARVIIGVDGGPYGLVFRAFRKTGQ